MDIDNIKSNLHQISENIRLNRQQSILDYDQIYTNIDLVAKHFSTITTYLENNPTDSIEILPILNECLKIFRSACSLNPEVQCKIAKIPEIFIKISKYLFPDTNTLSHQSLMLTNCRICWQFLANLNVNNNMTQDLTWQNLSNTLYDGLNNDHENADICAMIVYNIYIGGSISEDGKMILKSLLRYLKREVDASKTNLSDFLQIFLEHFTVDHKRITPIYFSLNNEERLLLLFFIADHLKQTKDQNRLISKEFLQLISKEFKKKSDCVLKTVTSYVETIQPNEVIALLDVIASSMNFPWCLEVLSVDSSLFLNVGCLLQSVHALGKKSENTFTPLQKLNQVAPNSMEPSNIERDISYGLKSSLVRVLGNLTHRNRKNQDLAREMDFLTSILECTAIDGRNPLIKEWSILAIRNLCENNEENQRLIAGLTKVGDADNSEILKEFNIDMGSLRIG